MAEKVGDLYYDVTLETRKMVEGERDARRKLERVGDAGDRLQLRMSRIAAAIGAALSAIAVEGLISKLVNTQRQFDVLFSSLKTVTGGAERAGQEFERLREFAAKTPYTLEQSIRGFVKLKALGLDPSERAMTSFGNTASAMGKSLEQMVEAVADASTGEFERLKEFGIKARVEGDQVALTFQGVTTRVRNNASEITEYLTKIGETNFAGAMSERMKTLDGDISNLQDSLDALYLTISQSGVGDAIAKGVRLATEAIQELSTSVKEGELTDYFANLRPLLAGLEVVAVSLAGAIAGRLISSFIAMAAQAYASVTALGAATVAARGFSAVLSAMGGPIGVAVTGLALLALNWDKVAGKARDAATISEDAATRIAAALRKSPGRATSDLAEQLAEANREIAAIDKKINSPRTVGRGVLVSRSEEEIADLRRRRAAIVGAAGDIQRAMDGLHGGQGRGRIVPPLVDPEAGRRGGDEGKKSKFDTDGFIAGLRARTLEGLALLDAEEAEAKRQLERRAREEPALAARRGEAIQLIEADFAKRRKELREKEAEEASKLDLSRMALQERLEQEHNEKNERAAKEAEERGARGASMARGIIGGVDPLAGVRFEYEEKLRLLDEWVAEDERRRALYTEAKLALEEATAERIAEIRRREVDAQAANAATSLAIMGKFTEDVYGMLQTAGRQQTALAKAMFLASKAIAVSEILLQTEVAAAKATGQLGIYGIPMATLIRAQGYASAGMVGGLAVAESFGGGRQYGGPATAGTLYRVNETGRPEMFTAANGAQYMLPTANGNLTPASDVAGGGVQWTINVNGAPPGTAARVDPAARRIDIDLAVQESAAQIIERRGPMWAALKTTNVRGQQ